MALGTVEVAPDLGFDGIGIATSKEACVEKRGMRYIEHILSGGMKAGFKLCIVTDGEISRVVDEG